MPRKNASAETQVNERSALHVMFGLPGREIRYALGYQMFGFREEAPKPAANSQLASASASTARRRGKGPATTVPAGAAATSSARARIRLSGFGQVGMGGAVGLCDPASGLVFAMTSNKVMMDMQWDGRVPMYGSCFVLSSWSRGSYGDGRTLVRGHRCAVFCKRGHALRWGWMHCWAVCFSRPLPRWFSVLPLWVSVDR